MKKFKARHLALKKTILGWFSLQQQNTLIAAHVLQFLPRLLVDSSKPVKIRRTMRVWTLEFKNCFEIFRHIWVAAKTKKKKPSWDFYSKLSSRSLNDFYPKPTQSKHVLCAYWVVWVLLTNYNSCYSFSRLFFILKIISRVSLRKRFERLRTQSLNGNRFDRKWRDPHFHTGTNSVKQESIRQHRNILYPVKMRVYFHT